MELFGVIENLTYKKFLKEKLKEIRLSDLSKLDINEIPPKVILEFEDVSFALSKWVSPKRTRSYPYARVYDTLNSGASKNVTVIPVVKDEGAKGDRDFLQWDTVSLMSLLNVYVIPAYYHDAQPGKNGKITAQKFDSEYVRDKLLELNDYHSSALHWNLKELSGKNLETLMNKVIECYRNIEKKTGIELHSEKGLAQFIDRLKKGVEEFKSFSRNKARDAQKRESVTLQPKERLGRGKKASITIKNYLGGYYYFTVDEVFYHGDKKLYLIEGKHSRHGIVPSKEDIKDGLLKMVLYVNISKLTADGREVKFVPILKLTSTKFEGIYKGKDIVPFIRNHKSSSLDFFVSLTEEARANHFEVWLEGYG